jgi:hypothetical protein
MPNGNDEFDQYKRKPAGDEFEEFKRVKTSPTPAVTQLEKEAGIYGSLRAKLGRGFVTGAASGVGVPETTSGTGNVTGFLGNVARGVGRTAGAVAQDVGAAIVDPFLPKEKQQVGLRTLDIARDITTGLAKSEVEALRGIKDRDPEQFAHGLGSALTQILTLGEIKEGKPESIAERPRLAKTAKALDIGKGEIKDLKTAMPEIVKQAQNAGINTVGDFGANVKRARTQVDQTFNQGMATFANNPVSAQSIADRIRNLETPDMRRTAEGRAQIQYLNSRAVEYEQPWTYRELNSKRATENQNLTSFYNKETRAQAASPLDTDISKAIRDGAADIVYNKWDQMNPGGSGRLLKQRQGALWAIDDYVNHPEKGVIADLEARQLAHEGGGLSDKLNPHVYMSHWGPRAHIGFTSLFKGGPQKAANAKIAAAFGGSPTPFKSAATAALPIGVLAGKKYPFPGPPPEPQQ